MAQQLRTQAVLVDTQIQFPACTGQLTCDYSPQERYLIPYSGL